MQLAKEIHDIREWALKEAKATGKNPTDLIKEQYGDTQAAQIAADVVKYMR